MVLKDPLNPPDPIERYPDVEFPIKVSHNPVVQTMPSGKRWAISGGTWIQVPLDATREDLPRWMDWSLPKPNYEEVKVAGSRGNTYTVRRNKGNNELTCSCPGFKWRGKCKHLTKAFPA